MTKRARPGIHQTFAVLPNRVREFNDTDCNKPERMIKYLNGTSKKYLTQIMIIINTQKKKMTLRMLIWSIMRKR